MHTKSSRLDLYFNTVKVHARNEAGVLNRAFAYIHAVGGRVVLFASTEVLEAASAQSELGLVLKDQGKYDEDRETKLGPENSSVTDTQTKIVIVLNNQGMFQETLELHEKVLKTRIHGLSMTYPWHLSFVHDLSRSPR